MYTYNHPLFRRLNNLNEKIYFVSMYVNAINYVRKQSKIVIGTDF